MVRCLAQGLKRNRDRSEGGGEGKLVDGAKHWGVSDHPVLSLLARAQGGAAHPPERDGLRVSCLQFTVFLATLDLLKKFLRQIRRRSKVPLK
jgi:hypothetical protein